MKSTNLNGKEKPPKERKITMPFTREFMRKTAKECGIELPKEFEDAMVNEHISTRDVYAQNAVEKYQKENKPAAPPSVKDSEEYKFLKKEFEDYKTEQANKETLAVKEKAVRTYLESKGIKGENLKIAMRGCKDEVGALEMDGEKIKDAKSLDALIAGDFAGLVTTTEKKGTETKTPPPGGGGGGSEPTSLADAMRQKFEQKG